LAYEIRQYRRHHRAAVTAVDDAREAALRG